MADTSTKTADLFVQPDEHRKRTEIPYSHKSLSTATSYRIMRLEPGSPPEDIWFSLMEYAEDGEDEYHAISYAWNSTVLTQKIYSANGFLQVTENLYSALQQYRLPDQSIWVWADAVCISQVDLEERAQQVQLMANIFSQCTRVLVWLGDEVDTDEATFEYIGSTVDGYVALLGDDPASAIIPREFASQIVSKAETEGHDKGLTSLFERSWFSRAWTFQEIVCSQAATISCGSLNMPCERLFSFIHAWTSMRINGVLCSAVAVQTVFNIVDCYLRRDEYRESFAGLSFIRTVGANRTRQCMDPRDKIYSVHGISRQSNPLPYPPDYTIDVNQLYQDFARSVISQSKSLEIFENCAFEGESASLATWAPNWTTQLVSVPFEDRREKLFHASNDREVEIVSSMNKNKLVVRGMLIDEVESLSGIFYMDEFSLGDISDDQKMRIKAAYQANFLAETFAMCHNSPMYADELEGYEAMWRTYTCDKKSAMKRATPDTRRDFQAYQTCVTYFNLDSDDKVLSDEDADRFAKVEELVLAATTLRRFCVSKDGRIGWVPNEAHKGDLVSIIFGSSTPVLLRPKGDSFLMIGKCYIHGIMDGEAMTEENVTRARPICLI